MEHTVAFPCNYLYNKKTIWKRGRAAEKQLKGIDKDIYRALRNVWPETSLAMIFSKIYQWGESGYAPKDPKAILVTPEIADYLCKDPPSEKSDGENSEHDADMDSNPSEKMEEKDDSSDEEIEIPLPPLLNDWKLNRPILIDFVQDGYEVLNKSEVYLGNYYEAGEFHVMAAAFLIPDIKNQIQE